MIPRFPRILMPVALAFVLLASPSVADMVAKKNPVVVELFTSQGCSSCPPADELLQELAKRDDVLPLALHVDYWDYIGWKDAFADPAFSKRQRAYAKTMGSRSVYTPQMIVNGSDSIVGAKAMKLADRIAAHKVKDSGVSLALSREGTQLRILAKASKSSPKMVIHMLRFSPKREVKITRGENAGRHMHYANVVYDWRIVAEWSGDAPLELDAVLSGDDPVVVLVQQVSQGPIMAAAQLR